MLFIVSGIISGVIWFSIFKEARFRAKCKYICKSDAELCGTTIDSMIDVEKLNNFVVVSNIKCHSLMSVNLQSGDRHVYLIKSKYSKKFCMKIIRKWVNSTYKKLKLQEKLSKFKE